MNCIISVRNKRPQEDLEDSGHFHQAKRLCNGFGSCGEVECGAEAGSPMDTRENQQHGLQKCNSLPNHHDRNMVFAAQVGVYPQMCPRCMAGESYPGLSGSSKASPKTPGITGSATAALICQSPDRGC
ncbi:uncharacterized protein si:ch211-221j21.3 [Conger conger]|uniref:uncharacterized protein si:ch211-221j21.3 n=1 Tax=Conger conger TaxID=82655 RepID=UPI002A59AE75|nr:uncharacterized protein si:ch211-221j21.3 [Conger conger]